jgi:predicted DNA-binding transcriptional regulator AlpA
MHTPTPIEKPSIDDALKNFDSLPNSAYVRLPVVAALFACSRSSVWRGVTAKRIPEPQKLSDRVTAWNVGSLRTALANIVKVTA